MEFETIIYEKKENIAKLTMNRPKVRNAQNVRMIEEMDIAFKDAERDPTIRVIILAGAGSTFSAGHDLKVYPVEEGAFLRGLNVENKWNYEQEIFYEKVFRTWDMKKPVIAQVQGYCLSGGFMIANMCDLIVSSEDAMFGDPVLRMGPTAVEVLCHPWVLPPRVAKEMLFTGSFMSAKRAYDLGMVNTVVPLEELEIKTLEIAGNIANMPPFGISMIKKSINRAMDIAGFRNSIDAHFDTHILSHFTDETNERMYGEARKEGVSISSFIKNRDAKFSD